MPGAAVKRGRVSRDQTTARDRAVGLATLARHSAPTAWLDASHALLSQVATSVRIAHPRQVAGNDTVIRPKNNPLGNRGPPA